MKLTSLKNYIIFLFSLLLMFSCSKNGNEPKVIKGVIGPKLVKIITLDITNGFQTSYLLTYDEFGRIKSENVGYANFVAEYNSAGQIALVTQTNIDGSKVIHTVHYNVMGQIFKKIITEGTKVDTIIYEYNTLGQLIKFNDLENMINEVTWNGDNISEIKRSNAGKVSSITKYTSYDDKIAPNYNIRDFIQITRLSIASKNNCLNLNSTVAAGNHFSYKYNSNGSVNLAVSQVTGIMNSFYYAP